jgi:hypothetical protein
MVWFQHLPNSFYVNPVLAAKIMFSTMDFQGQSYWICYPIRQIPEGNV